MRKMLTIEEIEELLPEQPVVEQKQIYVHNLDILFLYDYTEEINVRYTIYSHKDSIYSTDDLELLFKLMKNAFMTRIEQETRTCGIITNAEWAYEERYIINYYDITNNEPDEEWVMITPMVEVTVNDYMTELEE